MYHENTATWSLASPAYPREFLQPLTCLWLVQSDTGSVLTVEILDFELLGEDYLLIGNGADPEEETSMILSRKGYVIQKHLTSTGHQLWMSFNTDGESDQRTVFSMMIRRVNVTGW